ncbi:MAG: hypothetical protein NC090_06740 [Anaeroplasma bactoclasticum]|nr:hypothetical protein [Anaeroplasma bactoclasticum]
MFVENYHLIFAGSTLNGYVFEHCLNPFYEDGAYGIGITVGTGKGFSGYIGEDKYIYDKGEFKSWR